MEGRPNSIMTNRRKECDVKQTDGGGRRLQFLPDFTTGIDSSEDNVLVAIGLNHTPVDRELFNQVVGRISL